MVAIIKAAGIRAEQSAADHVAPVPRVHQLFGS